MDAHWKSILGSKLVELDTLVYSGDYPVEGNLLYNHNSVQRPESVWLEADAKRHKLFNLVKNKKNVLEIGINGGHSALIMLTSNPKLEYYGFDIGMHPYVSRAVDFLSKNFRNIHYIKGDSEKTLPNFVCSSKFDVIHVDGNHSVEKARKDLVNCRRFSHKDTIIIFDDCNRIDPVGRDLLDLWNSLVISGFLIEPQELNCPPQDWDSRVGRYSFKDY